MVGSLVIDGCLDSSTTESLGNGEEKEKITLQPGVSTLAPFVCWV